MSRRIVDLDAPDRFVPVAFGAPGGESFYLQAAREGRAFSVALGREQLALLAERMLTIIDELERRGLLAIDAGPGMDGTSLDAPLREDFATGALSIAWDDDGDRLIVEAHSISFDAGAGESVPPPEGHRASGDATTPWDDADTEEHSDDDPMGPDVLRVRLRPVMAQHFVREAVRITAANRQTCAVCGSSLGPGRHRCPGPRGQSGSIR